LRDGVCGSGRSEWQYQDDEDDDDDEVRMLEEDQGKRVLTMGKGDGKYPKKDCPAYSHPKANPTWYSNNSGMSGEMSGSRRLSVFDADQGTTPMITRFANGNVSARKLRHRKPDDGSYTCPAYGILDSQDLNEAIRCLTPLDPQDTYAQLNIRNLHSAAYCSINRYSIQEYDEPTLSCDAFYDEYECNPGGGRDDKGVGGNKIKLVLEGTNDDLLPSVHDIVPKGGKVCIEETETP
jgi:hypothetical protein